MAHDSIENSNSFLPTSTSHTYNENGDWALEVDGYPRFDVASASQLAPPWTRQQCVEHVLSMFPGISKTYVEDLYSKNSEVSSNDALCAAIVEDVVSNSKWPTQKDQRAKEAEEQKAIESAQEQTKKDLMNSSQYRQLVELSLLHELPEATIANVKATLKQEKTLTKAYAALADVSRSTMNSASRNRPSRRRRQTDPNDYIGRFPLPLRQLVDSELLFARAERALHPNELTVVDQTQDSTFEQTIECACCFSDVRISNTHHCDGAEPHHFCRDCIRRNVENEIGSRKCRPKCMDMSGCQSAFAEYQLRSALDEKIMGHLIRLRQQEDLKAAGLEGLEECPFCDFLDVCPPIAVNREFRCFNKDCLRVSCRRCHEDTHTPLSCLEAAEERDKDRKIDARHTIEEAMTDALIRICNNPKCKTKFVKIEGCNRMSCPNCHNQQCYVCSENIRGYQHFGNPANGKCPTHDAAGVEQRHREDVKKAEAAARAKIQQEMPDISEDDLKVKVSKEVQEAEAQTSHNNLPALRLVRDEMAAQLRELEELYLRPQGEVAHDQRRRGIRELAHDPAHDQRRREIRELAHDQRRRRIREVAHDQQRREIRAMMQERHEEAMREMRARSRNFEERTRQTKVLVETLHRIGQGAIAQDDAQPPAAEPAGRSGYGHNVEQSQLLAARLRLRSGLQIPPVEDKQQPTGAAGALLARRLYQPIAPVLYAPTHAGAVDADPDIARLGKRKSDPHRDADGLDIPSPSHKNDKRKRLADYLPMPTTQPDTKGQQSLGIDAHRVQMTANPGDHPADYYGPNPAAENRKNYQIPLHEEFQKSSLRRGSPHFQAENIPSYTSGIGSVEAQPPWKHAPNLGLQGNDTASILGGTPYATAINSTEDSARNRILARLTRLDRATRPEEPRTRDGTAIGSEPSYALDPSPAYAAGPSNSKYSKEALEIPPFRWYKAATAPEPLHHEGLLAAPATAVNTHPPSSSYGGIGGGKVVDLTMDTDSD